MTRRLAPALSLAIALTVGCGDDVDPRYGAVTLTADAPTATLSGVTHPTGPALDLAPGCAGYVDADAPDHVLEVRDPGKTRVRARSEVGPLVLVVREGDRILCDSDENTGHEPTLQLARPGRYAVHVGSLIASDELSYRLTVEPDAKDDGSDTGAVAPDAIGVSVTSEPSGASVRTPGGQVLGTTPAMFVLPAGGPDAGAVELVVELDGFDPQTLRGEPADGELVLHAELEPDGPEIRTLTANDPQPIRDFTSVRQTVTVEEDCTISHLVAEVDVRHSYVGDLLVQLRAPTGRVATLHRYRGANRNNLERSYDSDDVRMLRRLHGENGRGEWRLTVRDSAELDVGSLESFTLRLECGGEVDDDAGSTRATRRRRTTTATRRRRPPPTRRARQLVLDPFL